MQFRHEIKHEIGYADILILRKRLSAVMKADPYATDGRYAIRSLYFDSPDDKALREKIDGAMLREKYRIRLYNYDTSVIRLERKYKYGGLGRKDSALLTIGQAESIVNGNVDWMKTHDNAVIRGFYSRIRHERLDAKVIVDYIREPFVFPAGNVRVTLDYSIRTALRCTDFLNPHCPTIPVMGDPCILEVKWDNFLPDVIRNAVQLGDRHATAYSKYAACRAYE